MMTESKDIVVEVIVWDGSKETDNPYGHVTTKIIKNGIPYSYSLENSSDPHVVCNTEAFNLLEKKEQSLRSGVGFFLNISQEQAKDIFMSMQTRFHGYNKPSCIYHTLSTNCTYAIQQSIQKAGIDLYASNKGITRYPASVEHGLLNTRNNNAWLVKKIIQYPKGQDKGIDVKADQVQLIFGVNAILADDGWHSLGDYNLSENW